MKRILLAAVLATAACSDGGSNPMSADGSTPALSGSSLPNLYVGSISHNGSSATFTICNNGPVLAWFSRTFVSHWAGLYHEGFDIDHPIIYPGTCVAHTRDVYPGLPGVTHTYNLYADDYQEVAESNENDNHLSKAVS